MAFRLRVTPTNAKKGKPGPAGPEAPSESANARPAPSASPSPEEPQDFLAQVLRRRRREARVPADVGKLEGLLRLFASPAGVGSKFRLRSRFAGRPGCVAHQATFELPAIKKSAN